MSRLHIGEISISHTPGNKAAKLPCEIHKKSNLSLRLFDQYGYTCQKEEFQVKKGQNNLELDCSGLEAGDYSAWIELEGKTYLRGFSIQEEKKKKSVFKRFMDMIQPRPFNGAYY